MLKISHQFPASTGADGDFRDQLARKFAADVEKRTNGSLKVEVYPASSLVKTFAQFGAMRKGALDMSVLPIAYGGGEVPEANLGLMPALITSYEQGLRWKDAPIGKEWSKLLEDRGIRIVTWVWQAGGIASLAKPVVSPDDAKGMKIRGGSKEMDMMLKGAGAAITNVPSNEIYSAMQSGVLDAALTSSTSLISFRLYETGKNVTTARKNTFWFMFEPLVISKARVRQPDQGAAAGDRPRSARASRSSRWTRRRPTTCGWPRSTRRTAPRSSTWTTPRSRSGAPSRRRRRGRISPRT